MLVGCGAKQAKDLKIIWLDDECFLYAEGLSIKDAHQISENMSFGKCDIIVSEDIGKSAKE